MRTARGYTVVELITVMVVIGVLAAIALPRISQTQDFSAAAYRNEVTSALRHAQKSAVSHRRLVCLALAPQSINLTIAPAAGANACAAAYPSPDGNAYSSKDAAVQATGAFVGTTLFFQPNGDITTDGAGTVFAAGTIGITGQGDIRIDGSTGHVD